MEILLILMYQDITTKIKYLTCKHDVPQTHDCKGSHIKMTTIRKIGFTFVVQSAYPGINEISGRKESLTQQPYELLWQLHRQLMFTFLMFQVVDVIWWGPLKHRQLITYCLCFSPPLEEAKYQMRYEQNKHKS